MTTSLPGLADLLADTLLAEVLTGRRDGLLLLDYDGTLAPFRELRDQAVPYPGVAEQLARLPRRGSGRAIVVSGREPESVAALLGQAAPGEIWGCHGACRLVKGKIALGPQLSPTQAEGLDRAAAFAAGAVPAGALERKSVSVAVHWRALSPGQAENLKDVVGPAWAALARESGLTPHAFDGGLELRLPGFDKGGAIAQVRREHPDAVLVYCGDDATDEDAFRALDASGIGVLVRTAPRPTAARYRITPPGELLALLGRWAKAFGEPGDNHRRYNAGQ